MKHPVATFALAALLMAAAHGSAVAADFYANKITVIFDWTIYKPLPVDVFITSERVTCGPLRYPKIGSPKSGQMVTVAISEFCSERDLERLTTENIWVRVEGASLDGEKISQTVCRESSGIKYVEDGGEPLAVLVTFDRLGAFQTKCLY